MIYFSLSNAGILRSTLSAVSYHAASKILSRGLVRQVFSGSFSIFYSLLKYFSFNNLERCQDLHTWHIKREGTGNADLTSSMDQ